MLRQLVLLAIAFASAFLFAGRRHRPDRCRTERWAMTRFRRLFSRDDCVWYSDGSINSTPTSVIKYLYCTLFDHDMEPYNYDVAEHCKRCGIEDDRNIMTLWSRIRSVLGK
jgi:hypothetical protein